MADPIGRVSTPYRPLTFLEGAVATLCAPSSSAYVARGWRRHGTAVQDRHLATSAGRGAADLRHAPFAVVRPRLRRPTYA